MYPRSIPMICFAFCYLLVLTLKSQNTVAEIYQDAERYMRTEQYDLAIQAFYHISGQPDVTYKATICSLLSKQYHDIPITDYTQFETEKYVDPLYYFWLAKIYLKRLDYVQGETQLNSFLNKSEQQKRLGSYREEASDQLALVSQRKSLEITRLESPVNSKYAEMAGIYFNNAAQFLFASDRISADNFCFYVTSKGSYGWGAPRQVSKLPIMQDFLNVLRIGNQWKMFDARDQQLHDFELTESGLELGAVSSKMPMEGAHHIDINKYGTRVIFSVSNGRELDIYESFKLRTTGFWMNPMSISPQINTGYNEDFPFLTSDGKRLYFSSDRPGGMGQMDIYYSEFDDVQNRWGQPINAGVPINSMDNDMEFTIDSQGKAIFSSDRSSSAGDLDLFLVEMDRSID